MAPVLGVEVPSTADVDGMSPEFRRARLHRVTAGLLVLLDRRVLVAEDTHWFDDASAELLAHLVTEARRDRDWRVITTGTCSAWAESKMVAWVTDAVR